MSGVDPVGVDPVHAEPLGELLAKLAYYRWTEYAGVTRIPWHLLDPIARHAWTQTAREIGRAVLGAEIADVAEWLNSG